MCEVDVQLTRDGIAIVIHDETVNRTTNGVGAVAAMSLAELRALDAGIRFGAAFAGTRVPTLEEVLTLAKGRCALNVELKSADVEREGCRLLRAHGAISETIVSSFDWDALAAARGLGASLPLGVLADKPPDALLAAAALLAPPRFTH